MVKRRKGILIAVLVISFLSTSVVSSQVSNGNIFSPVDSVTEYSINPELNLDSIVVGNNALYLNNNLFRFEPNGNYCFVHLGTLDMPLQVIVLETNQNNVEGYLGGYVEGKKYIVDINEQIFLTCVANETGVITFDFDSTSSPMAFFIVVSARYDVNLNGIVNVQDASYIWSHEDDYAKIYDVNDDGHINVQDLSYIWREKGGY